MIFLLLTHFDLHQLVRIHILPHSSSSSILFLFLIHYYSLYPILDILSLSSISFKPNITDQN